MIFPGLIYYNRKNLKLQLLHFETVGQTYRGRGQSVECGVTRFLSVECGVTSDQVFECGVIRE